MGGNPVGLGLLYYILTPCDSRRGAAEPFATKGPPSRPIPRRPPEPNQRTEVEASVIHHIEGITNGLTRTSPASHS
jgi:hypothetical protein